MPFVPVENLKHPELRGEFICAQCGKKFIHKASLNKHRRTAHVIDVQCLICKQMIQKNCTAVQHMLSEHSIEDVVTCGCCNWTFKNRADLHVHSQSMNTTGTPGETAAIAISSRKPGSLSQHELRGKERTPSGKQRSSKGCSLETIQTDNYLELMTQLYQTPNQSLMNLVLPQPVVSSSEQSMPVSSPSSSSTSSDMEAPVPPTLSSVLTQLLMGKASSPEASDAEANKENNGLDDLTKSVLTDFLSGKAWGSSDSSESGIGSSSAPSPSPVSSPVASPTFSTGLAQMVQKTASKNAPCGKRSIDEICSRLAAKRTCN